MTEPSPQPLWTPTPERIERAAITAFARAHDLPEAYDELWRWSVDDIERFWATIWDHYDVGERPGPVLDPEHRGMPGARWFPEARLNFAGHLFAGRDPDAVAIRHASELRELAECTWGELAAQTARIRAGLQRLGVGEGDRVAAYLPNVLETVPAFLAVASLGAIWSSAAPEFGARSVIDRFAQIEPKVLLAVDGYRYGGRDFDRSEIVAADRRRDPRARAHRPARLPRRIGLGGRLPRPGGLRSSSSPSSPSTTRSGSSTPPGRPGCRSRSSTATAGSCSST